MNLLLIVIAILAFILFGLIVGIIIPNKIFDALKSNYRKRELLFATLTLLILPVFIVGWIINHQLSANSNSDYHNLVLVAGVISQYLFSATLGFLALGVVVKVIKKEGFSLLFWGSLFLAFTVPVILLFFGVPICEFLAKLIWDEAVTVGPITFY